MSHTSHSPFFFLKERKIYIRGGGIRSYGTYGTPPDFVDYYARNGDFLVPLVWDTYGNVAFKSKTKDL